MNPLYRNDRPGQMPPSWYVATADVPPLRPALAGDVRADVAVVGAGFTGLTAALELAQRGFEVVVVDAHRVGFGASGRNGGQVGSGYNMDQQALVEELGEGPARALWDLSREAVTDLQARVEAHAPEARWRPGVMQGARSAREVRALHEMADFLIRAYGYDAVRPLDRAAFQEVCRSPRYVGGLVDNGAGHIHPLRYALGLARAAEAAGAAIYELTEAVAVADGLLTCAGGKVRADHIVLAGNGYMPDLHPDQAARVMPINSFIAATEPLGERAGEVLARDVAVADDMFVVNYFRLSEDGRLLFGGRENYSLGFPKAIEPQLRARIERTFPQLKGVGIDYVWGGTLGITMTRVPMVQRLSGGVLIAAGFSGHGVALTGIAGRALAEMIAGDTARFDALARLPVPRFPGGAAARAPLLTLAMTWYALRDRLGF